MICYDSISQNNLVVFPSAAYFHVQISFPSGLIDDCKLQIAIRKITY
jgi:hypothetical protein